MIYSYNNVIWLNPKRNYDHITQINHNFHAGDHNTKLEKFGPFNSFNADQIFQPAPLLNYSLCGHYIINLF